MTAIQQLWYDQVLSDHRVLQLLRRERAEPCQQLHYLQMVTEKLGKAYLWRLGPLPKLTHEAFVAFLKAFDKRTPTVYERIVGMLGFKSTTQYENRLHTLLPLAYGIERMAPAIAQDGPNPEYPWPRPTPTHTPVHFRFPIWRQLQQPKSRQLLQLIDAAVAAFPAYA